MQLSIVRALDASGLMGGLLSDGSRPAFSCRQPRFGQCENGSDWKKQKMKRVGTDWSELYATWMMTSNNMRKVVHTCSNLKICWWCRVCGWGFGAGLDKSFVESAAKLLPESFPA